MSDQLLDWIDGARLLRWLEEDRRAIKPNQTADDFGRHGRMVRSWRTENRKTRVHIVDEFLCSIDVCLGEVPDDCFCEDPRFHKVPHVPVSSEKSERIAKLRELGWTVGEIAAMVGVTRRTAERHSRKAAA